LAEEKYTSVSFSVTASEPQEPKGVRLLSVALPAHWEGFLASAGKNLSLGRGHLPRA